MAPSGVVKQLCQNVSNKFETTESLIVPHAVYKGFLPFVTGNRVRLVNITLWAVCGTGRTAQQRWQYLRFPMQPVILLYAAICPPPIEIKKRIAEYIITLTKFDARPWLTFPTRPKGLNQHQNQDLVLQSTTRELGHSSEESPHPFCMPNLEDKCHHAWLKQICSSKDV